MKILTEKIFISKINISADCAHLPLWQEKDKVEKGVRPDFQVEVFIENDELVVKGFEVEELNYAAELQLKNILKQPSPTSDETRTKNREI